MMTVKRYKRALNKLFPLPDDIRGNVRFYAVVKSGFKFGGHNAAHHSDISTAIFRTTYLEYIRYNKDLITFYML